MNWKPVSAASVIPSIVLILVIVWLQAASPEHWVRILDDANLVFHEAGHPVAGLFNENLAVYGGTLGQLLFPAVCSVRFWRKGDPVAFALALGWLFENLLNISRYMADARAQLLPLVGGGEHDWTDIFSRWHVLHQNIQIAGFVAALGWAGLAGCGFWLLYRYLHLSSKEETD